MTTPPRDQSGSSVPGAVKVVLVTTVMLTFISFWRAAAVVLNDLASTAFYIGGIAEHAIGKSAPWFVLLVMIFSMCVRIVYMESCSLFVRGGVYRIVKEAMGSMMAKIAVSALVFDFVLTGPISSVSAGHYVYGLCETLLGFAGLAVPVSGNLFAIGFAVAVTCYFWWLNIKGIEESSDKALKIMVITGVMVVVLLLWSFYTIAVRGATLPPFEVTINDHAMGWLAGFPGLKEIGAVVFLVGFGHSLLAMSGEETLAQVYREIEAPKTRNLLRAALVIFVFSLTFTGLATMAAVMIVPDAERAGAGDYLLYRLVMNLEGAQVLRVAFASIVVAVGGLILSGAVNTSIIGSNGVLNRVAEDGILADWFRAPHHRFGTTYRLINLVVIMQLVTILASRGDIKILGEAYAFGVVWSFVFMSVSMLILRFKMPAHRAFRVPLNFSLRGREIPVGLGIVAGILSLTAVTNLLTKPVATVSGVIFTAAFMVMFVASEWYTEHHRRKSQSVFEHREKFLLERRAEVTPESLELPEGRRRILLPLRDPNTLQHLVRALEESHEKGTELVAMTVKVERGDQAFQHMFTTQEEQLFTKVVEIAEKYGESLVPVVIPSNNAWFAIARTAYELGAQEIILGESRQWPADIQMAQLALMWGLVNPDTNRPITLRIIGPDVDVAETI